MSKKGFLASLIIAIVATLSLSIYTIVSVVNPGSSKPSDTTVSLAFRSGETVEQLKGYTENKDLTFVLEEGQENPLEYNEEVGAYVAKDVNGQVSAVVTNKSAKTTYNIAVYHHNAKGLNADEPFIIATKAHMKEFADVVNETGANKVNLKYVSLVADVDLAGESWKPLGNIANTVTEMTFEGNDHVIKNMTQKITSANYKEFMGIQLQSSQKVAAIDLGFFGRMKTNCRIQNVKFEGAEISVSAEVYEIISKAVEEGAEYNRFSGLSIGTVVGYATRTAIDNVSVKTKINGFSYGNGTANGVGGVAGLMQLSQITNAKVDMAFTESVTHLISENETVYGSNVGGVVGYANVFNRNNFEAVEYLAKKNLIENCEVKMNVSTIYNNVSYVAGLVAIAKNTAIKNSNVTSLKVVDPTAFVDINFNLSYVTNVAGAVGQLFNAELENCTSNRQAYASEILNVTVNGLDANMPGGQISGLIALAGNATRKYSDATINIKDCAVAGSMTGFIGSGFAGTLNQEVEVSYSDEFAGNAVNVTVDAYSASAFAYELFGNVSGNAGKSVKVVANLIGRGIFFNPETVKYNVLYDNTFCAGFGYVGSVDSTATPKIENLVFELSAQKILSFAGVAHNAYGAQISNCDVTAKVVSNNYYRTGAEERNFSTTYMVAGVVNNAFDGTKIDTVAVNLSLNKDVDKAKAYGANYVAGVVARIHENNVQISNCTVNANAYVNDAYQTAAFKKDETTTVSYGKVFLAGGLVGSIQKRGTEEIDAFDLVDTSNVKFTNNTINFNIVADFKVEDRKAMGTQGYRVRAIGAVVGNINSNIATDAVLDLSTCTVSEYKVKADKVTFSYGYGSAGAFKTLSTLGLEVLTNEIGNNIIYSYGMSYNHNMGVPSYVKNPDLANASYEALDA